MDTSIPVPPCPPELPVAAAIGGPRRARRPRPARHSGAAEFLRNNIVLAVVAVAVLGVGGTALALGAPSRPSLDLTSAPVGTGGTTPPTSGAAPGPAAPAAIATPKPGRTVPRSGGQRTQSGHGLVVIQTGRGPRTVTFDRGTVAGLTYGAIVVEHPDGSTVTLVITSATTFRPQGRQPRVDDGVQVVSDGGKALIVNSRSLPGVGGNSPSSTTVP